MVWCIFGWCKFWLCTCSIHIRKLPLVRRANVYWHMGAIWDVRLKLGWFSTEKYLYLCLYMYVHGQALHNQNGILLTRASSPPPSRPLSLRIHADTLELSPDIQLLEENMMVDLRVRILMSRGKIAVFRPLGYSRPSTSWNQCRKLQNRGKEPDLQRISLEQFAWIKPEKHN